jgi:hypothetical protein
VLPDRRALFNLPLPLPSARCRPLPSLRPERPHRHREDCPRGLRMPATLGSENDGRTKLVAIWVTKSLARLGILKRRFTISGSAPVTRLTSTTSHPRCELVMPPTTFRRAGGNDDGWLAQKLGAHHLPCPDSTDGNYDHLCL